MPRRPVPVHRLRPNHAEATPPAVVFLDTEAAPIPGRVPEVLALNLWVAHYVDRVVPRKGKYRDEWGQGTGPDTLVDWVESMMRGRETVWLYAHNLSFDVITTRLPMRLAERGWEVTDAAVGGRSPWMRLRKGAKRLTLCDSWSWLPAALEVVGQAVGLDKPPLPELDADTAEWVARCHADVAILEAAVLGLMDWWDRNKLGRWTISGPACGWNAYRHIPAPITPVIDPDPAKVKADRLAVHGGRRGTWRVGELAAGPFVELDFRAAYPTIAAHMPVPVGRSRAFTELATDDRLVTSERWGIVARVLVETDVPRWPVRIKRRTWYPVGRFWADLAGPDIAEAARLGCLRAIGAGQVHRLGHSMAPWGQWVLSVMDGTAPDAPPVAQLAAKAWSRSVIGSWSARAFEKVKLGKAPGSGWATEEAWHHDEGVAATIVDLCGTRWQVTASETPDNAYPAVTAWVEAHVRTRLNRVIEALGPGCLVQCDTDGMLVALRTIGTPAAHGHLRAPKGLSPMGRLHWCLDQLEPVYSPLSLRIKATHDDVRVLGPQHVRLSGQRRYAGLPGMATEVEPDTFAVKQWPGLAWQLKHGTPAGYVRPEVRAVVAGPWPTGWILADRRVVPVEVAPGPDGLPRLLPWWSTSYARAELVPADVQHPALMPLL